MAPRPLPIWRGAPALAAIVFAAATFPTHARAADNGRGALQAQCFSPAALAARPNEQIVQRGDRRFDRAEPEAALAPHAPVPPHLRGAIRRVELPKGSRKLVALTLDFCEQPGEVAGYDGAIIDYLRQARVPATLFLGGKWMRSHDERTRQLMSDPLFEIGNHGGAHRNLRLLGTAEADREILGPQRAYEAIRADLGRTQCAAAHMASVPPRLSLFRFPFGACHAPSLAAVNDAGLLAIQWDVSTGDPSPATSAADIVAQMVKRTKPGSIVIAHANGRGHHTAAALPVAVRKLRDMGFEFVTVSDLLAAGRPVVVPTCYDSKPGDTDRYDQLFAARAKPSPRGTPWQTEIRR